MMISPGANSQPTQAHTSDVATQNAVTDPINSQVLSPFTITNQEVHPEVVNIQPSASLSSAFDLQDAEIMSLHSHNVLPQTVELLEIEQEIHYYPLALPAGASTNIQQSDQQSSLLQAAASGAIAVADYFEPTMDNMQRNPIIEQQQSGVDRASCPPVVYQPDYSNVPSQQEEQRESQQEEQLMSQQTSRRSGLSKDVQTLITQISKLSSSND